MSNDAAFPIAGIGASAGGVEALEGFFRGLPSQPGIGLVIVTHLSPTHESRIPEILTRFTTLPVHVAEHGMEVLPDAVYLLAACRLSRQAAAHLLASQPSDHGMAVRADVPATESSAEVPASSRRWTPSPG